MLYIASIVLFALAVLTTAGVAACLWLTWETRDAPGPGHSVSFGNAAGPGTAPNLADAESPDSHASHAPDSAQTQMAEAEAKLTAARQEVDALRIQVKTLESKLTVAESMSNRALQAKVDQLICEFEKLSGERDQKLAAATEMIRSQQQLIDDLIEKEPPATPIYGPPTGTEEAALPGGGDSTDPGEPGPAPVHADGGVQSKIFQSVRINVVGQW